MVEPTTPPDADLQQQLADLRATLQEAQDTLAAVKAGQGEPGLGAFQAMKNVVDAQQAVARLLSQHPELK